LLDTETPDLKVYLADYGLSSLKKYCKVFSNYSNINNWSPPEIWDSDNFGDATIDSYSFGVLMWEIETGQVPFEGID
jgi:serine/threonine protein kinase